jgi:phosphatidylserine decarboxylase
MMFVREAWPFVLPVLALALVLGLVGHPRWAVGTSLLALAILLFFRNPQRTFDGDSRVVLAPADGKVLAVDEVAVAELDNARMQRVITFLSVFDVHVQRCPVTGDVVLAEERVGAKVAAFRPEAGEVNQQRLTVIRTPEGALIGVRQIAGLVARRVVGYLEAETPVERGDLLGVIKFGSRVDLLVPPGYMIRVEPGQRVRAGETPMATVEEPAQP